MLRLIFVLKLAQDKYYVGSTTKPASTFKYLFSNPSEKWIKTYPPLYVCECIKSDDINCEKNMLITYMRKYGPTNVWSKNCDSFLVEEESLRYIKKNM
jgi:hypothetical protein